MNTANHLVSIEAAAAAEDSMGGHEVTWAEAFRWWCDIRGVRGREQERLGRLATVETYLLTGVYDERITSSHRVNWRGKIMNIRSAQDREGRRMMTTVECEAGVNANA